MIYLDYNATTPCLSEVVEAMRPHFETTFGNASSNHASGWMAKDAMTEATELICKTLNVNKKELIFTSGATESINMVLKGTFDKNREKGNHFITVKTEHKAVLDTCEWLESQGAEITYLDVNHEGLIALDALQNAIRKETILVCIMLANNETGVIQPIQKIGNICKENNVPLFSDATQALGKIPLDDFFNHVDYACFSAHKVYGPKGIGLVYMKHTTEPEIGAFLHGGGQQRKLRGGTLNTPLMVGFAKAISLAHNEMEAKITKVAEKRNILEKALLQLEYTTANGATTPRLPNTTNITFDYVDGEQLLTALATKLAVSNGSACNAASVNPSHVLTAMGHSRERAFSSLRFGVGLQTTEADIEKAVDIIKQEVNRLRENNILWEKRPKA